MTQEIKPKEVQQNKIEPVKETEKVKNKEFDQKAYLEKILSRDKEDEYDIMSDVTNRVNARHKAVYALMKAKSKKFYGDQWKTLPPKFYGGQLRATVVNGVGHINFISYELNPDDPRHKKLIVTYADIPDGYGKVKHTEVGGEYPIRFKVMERIELNKPIIREIIDIKNFADDIDKKIENGEVHFK